MESETYDRKHADIAWCPGCGNFMILPTLKRALAGLELRPQDVVLVSGIGQAAKTPHYLRANVFNGLHGRALPVATAIKATNPELTVIAESGDGCMYGEGGNHFLHAIRRNPDVTVIVHNNMVYGLTKGQASPTSQRGFRTPVQTEGTALTPFNPLAVALAAGATFVGRAFCQDRDQTMQLFQDAIRHPGLALVDVLQPCVSYNRVNTYQWFKEHSYYLEQTYGTGEKKEALAVAMDEENLCLGVLFRDSDSEPFHRRQAVYRQDRTPLWRRNPNFEGLVRLLADKRKL